MVGIMKFIKKCPVFLLLVSTGILLTILGIGGRQTIYSESELDVVTTPYLSLVFLGINEEAYPWQIFSQPQAVETIANGNETDVAEDDAANDASNLDENTPDAKAIASASPSAKPTQTPTPSPTPDPNQGTITVGGEILPYRESTQEEYMNHISADIYGTVGVERAAEYPFITVDENYFTDALFIGDSRFVGLRDYSGLADYADFYCETSLTIYDVFDKSIGKKGMIADALANHDYKKIYLEVGINELGRGTTEDFMEQYTKVVQQLREQEPEAVIFIQAIMRVSGTKDAGDAIFNNSNINARNNAIATLADNEHIFYSDVNEVVCDEAGNLHADYTFDQIHVLGKYNDLWKQFLMEHAVAVGGPGENPVADV